MPDYSYDKVGLDYDYDAYEEYEAHFPQPKNAMYADHRCLQMCSYEQSLNEGNPFRSHRRFLISHNCGGWKLFDNQKKATAIVQCPFCFQQMFVNNQVTIE